MQLFPIRQVRQAFAGATSWVSRTKSNIPQGLRLPALIATSASVVLLPTAMLAGQATAASSAPDQIQFQLQPNPAIVNCLAKYPGDPNRQPEADVTVTRGELNDRLNVRLRNIKPNLQFDLFTVQRSLLESDGTKDPNFHGFGMAWYQSDLEANGAGGGSATINTILLDQIFGFDPDVNLPPTNTFHVGFWFNNPNDAAACGFDPNKPTPFNGEHKAGPLAMISLPDADTNLGPLCTNPDTSTTPAGCNP